MLGCIFGVIVVASVIVAVVVAVVDDEVRVLELLGQLRE